MEEDNTNFFIQFYESVYRHDNKNKKVIELLGGLYTEVGRIDEGLKMDRRLIKLDPSNAVARYNLACSLALKNKKEEACESLATAISCGYHDINWIKQDNDLKSLHNYPPFKDILKKLES